MSSIPKTLHYCFGMSPEDVLPWGLVHYVCVKSAIQRITPEAVFFYYGNEPQGPWWELTRPLVQPIKIKPPSHIFGNPLIHGAHRADVFRLERLIEHGGIYLDPDVLVHRDFDDLLGNAVVLGQEGVDGAVGLANAVILAKPGASFLRRWYEEYRWFRSRGRDGYWNEHSIQVPLKLARQFPQEVTVLPHTAFCWPLWSDDHLAWIFEFGDRSLPSDKYANHLWESLSWERYLENLTPGQVRRGEGHFHAWARPLLEGLPDDFGGQSALQRLKMNTRSFSRAARARLRTLKDWTHQPPPAR